MNDPEKKENVKDEGATEWPHNPPLPPRELDPDGEGDALRKVAAPGDDIVFEANAEPRDVSDADATKKDEPKKQKSPERSQPQRG